MNNEPNPRALALDLADRAERQYKTAFIGAALVEAMGLAGFVALADFHNRMHVLLLVAAMLIYGTLAMGLVTLGAYMNRCTLKVLKALELSERAGA
ncbi:MAG: hypothetical protein U0166_26085 [Acidobacteriota bacterium]